LKIPWQSGTPRRWGGEESRLYIVIVVGELKRYRHQRRIGATVIYFGQCESGGFPSVMFFLKNVNFHLLISAVDFLKATCHKSMKRTVKLNTLTQLEQIRTHSTNKYWANTSSSLPCPWNNSKGWTNTLHGGSSLLLQFHQQLSKFFIQFSLQIII